MTFAEEKLALRTAVHETFAVAATYRDAQTPAPVALTVRWHSKDAMPYGDVESDGYAQLLSRIDRLVFNRTEVTAAGVRLRRGGRVVFSDYGDAVFELDLEDPRDGPVTTAWSVTRPQQSGGHV